MFEVGDKIESLVSPTMSGTVIKIFGGTGNLLVRIYTGHNVVADPEYWRLLKKGEQNE